MNKFYNTVFGFAIVALSACGNAKEEEATIEITTVPEAVLTSFKERFITGTDIKWHKREANYAVEFTQGESNFDATFLPDGELIEVEAEVRVDMIPNTLTDYISIKYKDATILEADRVMNNEGNFYEVEIEQDGQEKELVFDTEGNFIKEKK